MSRVSLKIKVGADEFSYEGDSEQECRSNWYNFTLLTASPARITTLENRLRAVEAVAHPPVQLNIDALEVRIKQLEDDREKIKPQEPHEGH